MREVSGAILVLAGSILIAAGIVADAVGRYQAGPAKVGYVLGAVIGLVGVALLVGGVLRRAWEAIPAGEERRA
jgi:hypothetical protein